MFDPVLGEFLSPDPYMPNPVGHGLNGFAYVNNQPLDFVDPSGFWSLNGDAASGVIEFEGVDPVTASAAGQAAGASNGATATSSAGNSFSAAGTALGLAQLGVQLAEVFTKQGNPHTSQGVPGPRGPQTRGATVPKAPTDNPVQPSRLDPGHKAWNTQKSQYRLAQFVDGEGDGDGAEGDPFEDPEIKKEEAERALENDPELYNGPSHTLGDPPDTIGPDPAYAEQPPAPPPEPPWYSRWYDGVRDWVEGWFSPTPEPTEPAPTATNPRLQSALRELFRASEKIPGGTAGAIRHELKTGELVGGKSHLLKGQERATQLERILSQEELSPADRATAEGVLRDLRDALSGR